MKKITSRNNPLIKKVVALHQAKQRKTEQQFIAEGIRTCSTLIDSGYQPITLYVVNTMLDQAKKFIEEEKIILVPETVMKKISRATTPSGLLALFPIPPAPSLAKLTPGIVLAQINNPGNMGTLIRSAAAMNKTTVVVIEGVDPWHPKVIQASAGTIGLVTIFQLSWQELIQNKGSLQLCALVVSHGLQPSEVNLSNALLVIGSETAGIPQDWLDNCDEKLTLAMPGKIESLNAAVAGSIALYLSIIE
ncbi:MAG TPA: RNA methyltransferase [Candidatus Dependentiae bacterium]|nr:RNA methyltransferase [Candidatus Dependentiae bacterium]